MSEVGSRPFGTLNREALNRYSGKQTSEAVVGRIRPSIYAKATT